MYVCCCMAVTEDEVDAAIRAGAHTRAAVTRACRAGGDCGSCHHMIETMIEDHLEERASSPGPRPAEHGPELVSAESLVRGRAA
jgi:bacterioferritin-associated ferredoxin